MAPLVINQSRFPVQSLEQQFYGGAWYHCLSAKVTLGWDENDALFIPEEQPDWVREDVWHGEPNRSSLLIPSELIPYKPTSDVIVTGTARPPTEKPNHCWDATLTIGEEIKKTLRLYGPRVWRRGLTGWTLSDAEPCTGVALLYENAYGGVTDAAKAHFKDDEYYPGNPFGCGFRGAGTVGNECRAARIEMKNSPLRLFNFDVKPGGWGAIPGYFPDRYRHIGTWDKHWKKKEAPYIPHDMDMHYWNTAPADQQPKAYLRAGDHITLSGVRAGKPLRLVLPQFDGYVVRIDAAGRAKSKLMNLDTVRIDLDDQRMTLRYHLRVERDADIPLIKVIFGPSAPIRGM